MTIRTATISDAADIARIHIDTWCVAYAGIVSDNYLTSLSKEKREKRWARTLSDSTEGTRVATLPNGLIVGWTSFGPSRDDDDQGVGELYAIYLDSRYWGKGIGKELIQDAVSQLMNSGCSSMTLWVLEDNLRARGVYERVGFKHDGLSKIIEIDGRKLVELRYHMIAQPGNASDAFGAGDL